MSFRCGVVAALGVFSIGLSAQTPAQGWTLGIKTTVDSGRGGPPVAISMRMEATTGMTRNEISITPSPNPMAAGMYIVQNDDFGSRSRATIPSRLEHARACAL